MYLSCEFGELAVVLHSGLIYRDHFETLPTNACANKIRFAYCPRLVVYVAEIDRMMIVKT